MSQPPKPVERREISEVFLHDLFFEISDAIGYTYDISETYLEDIEALIELWTDQGFIEIYTENVDRKYGRVKDTNSTPNSSPWYIGLYHARLLETNESDPLIVIVFEEITTDGEINTVASLRFMLDHDDMFGPQDGRTKFNSARMTEIRKKIDRFIQQGTNYVPDKSLQVDLTFI